ncbi:hypothetical protein N7460_010439 [Penicillium canescens]|uniref:Xylanolytic transcriptional activator regulatory domain-containing protein n=1 Tax=Penicillium canescens TaxID=5083 RepID=A0AAD6I3L7_PENCN|nr:hypothetical protein N7460_010439 [Penicillium canescens]KAJ6060550.1 hypothetical protein N7444_002404 [Penicillium canescens]
MTAPSSPEQSSQTRRATGVQRRSSRRRACNECKQQKPDIIQVKVQFEYDERRGSQHLRSLRETWTGVQSGINIPEDSQAKPFELENEVRELRRQLVADHHRMPVLDSVLPENRDNVSNQIPSQPPWATRDEIDSVRVVDRSCTLAASTSERSGLLPDVTEHPWAPSLTTKPVIDSPQQPEQTAAAIPQSRSLGNVTLSVQEIDELFTIYMKHYHPFLPFLDPSTSPHDYYQSSQLLFWAIISAASRQLESQPTLLPKLARSVTDLLWQTLRSIPHSHCVVQSLIILCAWPFPTSSSAADPTYVLAGMMVLLGSQMGLHQPLNAQDFAKVSLNLGQDEYSTWVKTWKACNIVAHSVGVGCGLPTVAHLPDWSLKVGPGYMLSAVHDANLDSHLQIERFRHRVTLAFELDPGGLKSKQERLVLYRLLNSSFSDLEREMLSPSAQPLTRIYLSAARLHLHSFYLFDESAIDGYTERIVTLYQTACSFVEQSLELDSESSFFHYCPFFCYQVFVCASLIILKIITNSYFQSLLDVDTGKKMLNSVISTLRKMSIANNDLPARLSDVISFFCSLPESETPSARPIDGLQLRVRNRLSMSIVYDSLWEWRRHFQASQESNNNRSNSLDKYHTLGLFLRLLTRAYI